VIAFDPSFRPLSFDLPSCVGHAREKQRELLGRGHKRPAWKLDNHQTGALPLRQAAKMGEAYCGLWGFLVTGRAEKSELLHRSSRRAHVLQTCKHLQRAQQCFCLKRHVCWCWYWCCCCRCCCCCCSAVAAATAARGTLWAPLSYDNTNSTHISPAMVRSTGSENPRERDTQRRCCGCCCSS